MGDGVLGEKVIETSNGEQEEQQRNTAQKVFFFLDTGQQQSLSLTLHGKEQSTCSTKQLLFCYTEQ